MSTFSLYPLYSPIEYFVLTSTAKLVEELFSHLPPNAIFQLRLVNSSFFYAVESYRVRVWRPARILKRFFSDVPQFLRQLELYDGIVSGAHVLHFLRRTTNTRDDADLEVIIPSHGLLKLGRWLMKQGYVFRYGANQHHFFEVEAFRLATRTLHPDQVDYSIATAVQTAAFTCFEVFRFVRSTDETGHLIRAVYPLSLHLVVVLGDPVNFIVNNYHSTGVMNYMTSKYAVSLFPRSTFIDGVTYTCKNTAEPWIEGYRRRNMRVICESDEDDVPDNHHEILRWDRFVGDEHTWILSFELAATPSRVPHKHVLGKSRFEVAKYRFGTSTEGAYLRVGPSFVSSTIAFHAGD